MLTVMFWLLFGGEIIGYGGFEWLDSEDYDVGLTIVRILGRIITQTDLVCVLTIAAEGWCITQLQFPTNDGFCFSALGLAATACWSLPELIALHQFELASEMTSVLAGAIVLREMHLSCQDSS
jgi:hypothetical protein